MKEKVRDCSLILFPWIRIDRRETDDTPFRLYRESNPALKTHTWISVAGTIEEIQTVAKELEEEDGSKHALALKEKIIGAIPRFEEGETVCTIHILC